MSVGLGLKCGGAGRPVTPTSAQTSGASTEGPTARAEGGDGATQHALESAASLNTHTVRALASLLASQITKFPPAPEKSSTVALLPFATSFLNLFSALFPQCLCFPGTHALGS